MLKSLKRGIRNLLALVALFLGIVHSASAAAPTAHYKLNSSNGSTIYHATKLGACTEMAGIWNGLTHNANPAYKYNGVVASSDPTCYLQIRNPSNGATSAVAQSAYSVTQLCPGSPPTSAVNGVCPEPVPVCTAGEVFNAGWVWDESGSDPFSPTYCSSSCEAVQNNIGVCAGDYCLIELKSTGQTCVTDTPTLVRGAPTSCPVGTLMEGTGDAAKCVLEPKLPPTCWEGSTNVSTDPDFALCVGDLPGATAPVPDPVQPPTETESEIQKPPVGGAPADKVHVSETTTPTTTGTNIITRTTVTTTTDSNGTQTTKTEVTTRHDPPSVNGGGPTGYKGGSDGPQECGTPGLPKCQIEGMDDPSMDRPGDPQGDVDGAIDGADSAMDAARQAAEDSQQSDKDRFFSWVWTPPVGECTPHTGTVHGFNINWDLCPTVNNIRDVLGWLMGLFSAFTIYGTMFRKD